MPTGSYSLPNISGRALLSASDGLALEGGRLKTAVLTEQSRLDSMIRSAIVPLGSPGSGWTRISRQSGRLPYAVFAAPLNVTDEELTSAHAKVLLMVPDTSEHRRARVDMLTEIYGLTETEARLASALSGGHSLETAAALLAMQATTARTHLKAVFRKLGVNRQQDLVRLLTSLSSIHV